MAQLDLTAVVNDPMFTEPAIWQQRTVAVGLDGVAVYVQTDTPIMVVPTAGDGSTLNEQRDDTYVEHNTRFYTTARLSPGLHGAAPDRILWDGRVYQVRSVGDWTTWGVGFVSASCALLPPDGGVRALPE